MLFKNRNYLLYVVGLFISLFGTFIYTFAIGLHVLDITNSSKSFAFTLILGVIPVVLFSPISGIIVDQKSKKALLVTTDFLNGCIFLSLFIVSKAQLLSLPIIYSTTFIVSMLSTLFDNTMTAAKTIIFNENEYEKVNATSQVIRSLAIICAPVFGGFIYGFVDISIFILLNGLSFIFSAVIEMFLSFPKHIPPSELERSFTKDFKDGFSYIKNNNTIHVYILYFLILNFVIGFGINVPLPYIFNNVLQKPPALLGTVQTCFPIGLLLGGFIIPKLMRIYTFEQILHKVLIIFIMLLLGISLLSQLPLLQKTDYLLVIYLGIINFAFGLSISFVDVPITTILQKNIETAFIGRVMGIIMSLVKCIYPLGLGISGILSNKISPYLLPAMGALMLLIFSIFFNKIHIKVAELNESLTQ